MMQCPAVICGFGVDRHRAEHLLADQPVVSRPCNYLPAPWLTVSGSPVVASCVVLVSMC